jgi:hypothetical protein
MMRSSANLPQSITDKWIVPAKASRSAEWAGFVRVLLGVREALENHQSVPKFSPPAGVTAAHQVVPDIDAAKVRTLPSARATTMPPGCGVEARDGSQLLTIGRT